MLLVTFGRPCGMLSLAVKAIYNLPILGPSVSDEETIYCHGNCMVAMIYQAITYRRPRNEVHLLSASLYMWQRRAVGGSRELIWGHPYPLYNHCR